MAMEFYGHQIKDGEIDQLHLQSPFALVTQVQASNVISADLTAPPGGESDGDTYIPAATATGAWAGLENHLLEYSGGSWLDHGTVVTGWAIRLAVSPSGATFSGQGNKIAVKTASGWDFRTPSTGLQCVQISDLAAGGLFDKETYQYDGVNTTWVSVGEVVQIANTDNVLQITNGQLTHSVSEGTSTGHAGHVWTNPNAYGFGIVAEDTATEPPSPVAGYTYIATAGGTWTGSVSVSANDYVYWDGNGWTVIGSRTAKDLVVVAPSGAGGSFTGHDGAFANWDGSNYDFIVPRAGDQFVNPVAAVPNVCKWQGVTFVVLGTSSTISAQDPSDLDGDGIHWNDTIRRLEADLKANAGLNIDGGEIAVVAETSAGINNQPTATDQLITKSAMDAYLSGLSWKEPSLVLKMTDDTAQAGSPPAGASAGDAWVVAGSWGAANYQNIAQPPAAGDIAEYDGNGWNLILANSGGEPPDGTRVTITDGTAGGSFTGQEEDMAVYDATGNSWSFETPADGDAEIIYGDDSVYADNAYTWSGTAWVQFSNILYTAGFGLDLSGNQFAFDYEKASATKSSGTTWDTGLGANVDGDQMMIFRNGQLQEKVAASPGAGQYTWSAGTATFGQAFDAQGEWCYAFGPGV